MKKLALIVALFGFSSCSTLQQGGQAICEAQESSAVVISRASSWLGLGGVAPILGDCVNLGLELFCTLIDAGLSAPGDLTDGIFYSPPPETDQHPGTDVETDDMQGGEGGE